jgi:hypothetical protein
MIKSIACHLVFIFLSVFSQDVNAQISDVWFTYSKSKFMHSPGIEFNCVIKNKVGVYCGLNAYVREYRPIQIVNTTDTYRFNFFNSNVGFGMSALDKDNFRMGLLLGFKVYYGPDYQPLSFYNAGGYFIYHDASGFNANYGIDFGAFFSVYKISGLLKYDTARQLFRFGLGIAIFSERKG